MMDFVHQNSSGTVQVMPLSCTSWSMGSGEDRAGRLEQPFQGLCCGSIGGLFVRCRSTLKKRIHGNVGNSTFSHISEAVGDVNKVTSPGLPSECC